MRLDARFTFKCIPFVVVFALEKVLFDDNNGSYIFIGHKFHNTKKSTTHMSRALIFMKRLITSQIELRLQPMRLLS